MTEEKKNQKVKFPQWLNKAKELVSPNWMYQTCHYLNKLLDIWKRDPSPTHSSMGTTALDCSLPLCRKTPILRAHGGSRRASASGQATPAHKPQPRHRDHSKWFPRFPSHKVHPCRVWAQMLQFPGQHNTVIWNDSLLTFQNGTVKCRSCKELPIRQLRHSQCWNNTVIPD